MGRLVDGSLTFVPVAALNHQTTCQATRDSQRLNLHRQLRFPPALVFKRLLLAILRVTAAFPALAALSVCPVMSARAAAAAADAEKKAATLAAAAKQAAIAAAAEEQARELKAKIDAAAGVIAPLAQHF